MDRLNNQRLIRWSFALLWVIVIFSTLTLVVPLSRFLRAVLPLNIVIVSVYLILLLFLSIKFISDPVLRHKPIKSLAMIAVLISYIIGLMIIKLPEEKIHFIEYGVLAVILWRALRVDFDLLCAYGGAFILTALLGWADEGVQYLLPDRVYELKDVAVNCLSGFMALTLIYVFRNDG